MSVHRGGGNAHGSCVRSNSSLAELTASNGRVSFSLSLYLSLYFPQSLSFLPRLPCIMFKIRSRIWSSALFKPRLAFTPPPPQPHDHRHLLIRDSSSTGIFARMGSTVWWKCLDKWNPLSCLLARARSRTHFCNIIHRFDVSIDSPAKSSATFTRFRRYTRPYIHDIHPLDIISRGDNNNTSGAWGSDGSATAGSRGLV